MKCKVLICAACVFCGSDGLAKTVALGGEVESWFKSLSLGKIIRQVFHLLSFSGAFSFLLRNRLDV